MFKISIVECKWVLAGLSETCQSQLKMNSFGQLVNLKDILLSFMPSEVIHPQLI